MKYLSLLFLVFLVSCGGDLETKCQEVPDENPDRHYHPPICDDSSTPEETPTDTPDEDPNPSPQPTAKNTPSPTPEPEGDHQEDLCQLDPVKKYWLCHKKKTTLCLPKPAVEAHLIHHKDKLGECRE